MSSPKMKRMLGRDAARAGVRVAQGTRRRRRRATSSFSMITIILVSKELK